MYTLGGTLVLSQRYAFAADESQLRLKLANGLTKVAMVEESELPVAQTVNGGAPLSLKLTTDPQDFPEDENDIPDLTRSVLPERERGTKDQPPLPAAKNVKSSTERKNPFGMTLAPVRWGGYTKDVFRMTKNSEGSNSLDHSQQLDLRAASYLWQPWFATVNGSLGIGRGVQDSGDVESKSDSITGSGDVTLFPQSRFPFTASFSISDSSTSTDVVDNGTRQERYSLRQQYRPKQGNAVFSASYDNTTISSLNEKDDTVESLRGTYGDQIGNHTISVEANRTQTGRANGVEGLVLNSINASHSYSPAPTLSLSNSINVSDSQMRQLQSLQSSNVDSTNSRYFQASSSANWRPKEDLPLNVSGGINFFNAQSEANGEAHESQSINGNLGLSYFHNITRNLTISLGGNVNATDATSDGFNQRIIYITENATANYAGDPLTLGKFSYNWNLSSSFLNQTLISDLTPDAGSTQSYTAGATHNLIRTIPLWERSTLNVGLNQSVATRWGNTGEQSSTLNTGGNLSWQVAPTNSMTASISLSANDTRTMGIDTSDNQFINLQGNANLSLSAYSSLSASANMQLSRQGANGVDENSVATTSFYTSGSLSYQHSRAFKVNNLQYSALATINMQRSDKSLLGDTATEADPIGYSIDQRLDYRIGRIDFGATATLTHQGGKENALLYIQMGRTFGNY